MKGIYKRTDYHSQKIREGRLGMKFSQEHRKNISIAKSKYRPSPETLIKMSIAAKKIGLKPPSHKGKTYEDIYGKNYKDEIEKRRLSIINFYNKKGRNPIHRNKHTNSKYRNWRKSVFE